jgi:hypothetical protein
MSNTTGDNNTAVRLSALQFNVIVNNNTAVGFSAIVTNNGNDNTAIGQVALALGTTRDSNTAIGSLALQSSDTNFNTAVGFEALVPNTTGADNIAIGADAGSHLTTGDLNIDIGNVGVSGESATTRIGFLQTRAFIAGILGTPLVGSAVVINANGQLGVAASSERFKDSIKPMNEASESILVLKPVTFHYKQEIDPEGSPQFGLVAEEVEKVNPALVRMMLTGNRTRCATML